MALPALLLGPALDLQGQGAVATWTGGHPVRGQHRTEVGRAGSLPSGDTLSGALGFTGKPNSLGGGGQPLRSLWGGPHRSESQLHPHALFL